ncbi:MAG: hypothetical protein PHQ35_11410 [Phycisphaerae bacterium]|nr:hypothetical protein [Phycisphaerae bacterium]
MAELEGTPPVTGQGNPTPQPAAPVEVKPEYFHEFTFDGDKEPTRWKSKDELNKYLREGTLRHADYTKHRMRDSEERDKFKKDREDFEARANHLMTMKAKYDDIDKFLTQRADVRERIAKEMGRLPQNNELEDKFMKELQAIKDEMGRRDQEALNEQYRNEVFDGMGKKYEDFNKDDILAAMKEVEGYQSLPPKAAMEAFADLLYHASKGKMTPAQVEERMALNMQKKQSATKPMPGGATPIKGNGKYTGTMDEIAFALKKDLR